MPTICMSLRSSYFQEPRFNPKRFIVKIQRPLMTNAAQPQALIYDATRMVCSEWPLTPELLARFEGDFKIYVWASLKKGMLNLYERAEEQEW